MGPVKVYIPAYDIQPLSMTLDVRAKILPGTHCLIMVDICNKLFENCIQRLQPRQEIQDRVMDKQAQSLNRIFWHL